MLKFAPLFGVVLSLSAMAPAAAMAEQISVRVPYADLNLTSESGRAALNRRIAQATRQICGAPEDERDLARQAQIRTCIRDVMNSASTGPVARLDPQDARLS
jgi:UrcA family protein